MNAEIDKFRENSIKYCVEQNTVEGLAEAIAICISNIRDDEGKYLAIRLSNDPVKHMNFCMQIAKQLKIAELK